MLLIKLLEKFKNDCGESVESNLADFSFYFTSYEKDILCFSPYINIFLECLELDKQLIIADIKGKIDESIVVKNKGSKYLLHEEKIVEKIKKLKSTLGTRVEKKIIPEAYNNMYKGCPCVNNEDIFKKVSDSAKPKFEIVTGNNNNADAKIAGITPAVFIFKGK